MTIGPVCAAFHAQICNPSDFRLSFGVPLEDVCRGNDLHPSLKRLFVATYQSFCTLANNFTKRQLQQCLQQIADKSRRLDSSLIDALTFNRPLPEEMPFEFLLDALRYFLQSLPFPLMSWISQSAKFNWIQLSGDCRRAFETRLSNEQDNNTLVRRLTDELLRLPRVNLLLIGYFVNFLRSLVWCGQRFSKHSAVILVNYFAPSIFHASSNKNSQVYHPLMLFLLIKWPCIQGQCIRTSPKCFRPYLSRCHSDFCIQTSPKCWNKIHAVNSLSTIHESDEPASNRSDVGTKNVSCQTKSLDKLSNNVQTSSVNLNSIHAQTSQLFLNQKPGITSTSCELLQPVILHSNISIVGNGTPVCDSLWDLINQSEPPSQTTKSYESNEKCKNSKTKKKTKEATRDLSYGECYNDIKYLSTDPVLQDTDDVMDESNKLEMRTRSSLLKLLKSQSNKIRNGLEFVKRTVDRTRSEEYMRRHIASGFRYKRMGDLHGNRKGFTF